MLLWVETAIRRFSIRVHPKVVRCGRKQLYYTLYETMEKGGRAKTEETAPLQVATEILILFF